VDRRCCELAAGKIEFLENGDFSGLGFRRGVLARPRPGHGHFAGKAGFERIADLGKFLLPNSSEFSGRKLLAMAVPPFSAVGMFDGWPVFAMPLSFAVPAFAKRTLYRRAGANLSPHAERIPDVLIRASSVSVKRDGKALNSDACHFHAFLSIDA
jgi:hypothetical protein